MPAEPLEPVVLGMTSHHRPTTARTVRAAVTDDRRHEVDRVLARLVDRGILIETKKHTYLLAEGA